ncbi:MAG: universal stress protein [Pikeienuella sp.]|uniref:universal stress protein n=1 Tax=Pikeienuella sp. TaxID=2831957 RepID=UPI00391CE6E9
MALSSILAATDFSARSERSVARAARLAAAHGAALILVHVMDDDRSPALVGAERAVAEALLQKAAASLAPAPSDVLLLSGDPFQEIAAATERGAPDLLVVGAHRPRPIGDYFIGTTAERVIRASRRPVLMAKGPADGAYRRVLVAVDFSAASATAARALAALELAGEAEVVLVHVRKSAADTLFLRGGMTIAERERSLAEISARLSERLAAFAAHAGLRASRRIVASGDEGDAGAILATAEAVGADLVVIGTRGRSRGRAILLGGVAEAVLRDSAIDVLAVPMR